MVSKVGVLGFITKVCSVWPKRKKLIHLTSAYREVQILLLPKVKIIISNFAKYFLYKNFLRSSISSILFPYLICHIKSKSDSIYSNLRSIERKSFLFLLKVNGNSGQFRLFFTLFAQEHYIRLRKMDFSREFKKILVTFYTLKKLIRVLFVLKEVSIRAKYYYRVNQVKQVHMESMP